LKLILLSLESDSPFYWLSFGQKTMLLYNSLKLVQNTEKSQKGAKWNVEKSQKGAKWIVEKSKKGVSLHCSKNTNFSKPARNRSKAGTH